VFELFLVRIDFAKLRPRLSLGAGHDLSNGDAFQWLRSRGFVLTRGSWVAPLPALHALEPGEIIMSNRIDDLS
jgi:hypothetical protein